MSIAPVRIRLKAALQKRVRSFDQEFSYDFEPATYGEILAKRRNDYQTSIASIRGRPGVSPTTSTEITASRFLEPDPLGICFVR